MGMRELTDWAAKGRAEKVAGIVSAIDAGAEGEGVNPFADAEEIARKLRGLTKAEWHKIQREAGFGRRTPPSDLTVNAVIDTYQRRVDVAREELSA